VANPLTECGRCCGVAGPFGTVWTLWGRGLSPGHRVAVVGTWSVRWDRVATVEAWAVSWASCGRCGGVASVLGLCGILGGEEGHLALCACRGCLSGALDLIWLRRDVGDLLVAVLPSMGCGRSHGPRLDDQVTWLVVVLRIALLWASSVPWASFASHRSVPRPMGLVWRFGCVVGPLALVWLPWGVVGYLVHV